jgi:nitroimidazol reductase NimA-like FMN-containing flavoprotein (pyridoxamine 5'-phosphate oxidase superfamily)
MKLHTPALRDEAPPRDELRWIEVLDQSDCWRRLAPQPVGRIAFIDAGEPHLLPVNFAVQSGAVVFRTSSLFATTTTPAPVAFEVDQYSPDTRTGWSIVVRGSLTRVVDAADVAGCAQTELLGWAPGDRDHWFRILPSRITGRVIGRRLRGHDCGYLPYMPPD